MSGSCSSSAWYSEVAARLLQERLLLTALELHTELVEAGREEPQLREFFSNPANFSSPTPNIVRCPSQATLDSLDLTRLSEDSEKSDDVAVLEFELRKAKETIDSLRANLTRAAEYDSGSSDIKFDKAISEEPIKPHERRALNFLIYEYLLQQDCKLTSITFSDEVTDQDFECWDDVGLNIPRPADLVTIYRGEISNLSAKNICHKDTQTDDTLNIPNPAETEEIFHLKKQILALETDKLNYQKLYDAAIASLNSLTSPVSDIPSSETTLYNRDDHSGEIMHSTNMEINCACESDNIDDEMQPLPQTASQNYYSSSVSTNSLTPDQFEMIDSDKNGSSHKDESNMSSYEHPVMIDNQAFCSKSPLDSSPKYKSSITTLDDTISFNDNTENEWEKEKKIRIHRNSDPDEVNSIEKSTVWINSDIPSEYKADLMNYCNSQYTKENVFFKEIVSANQPITLQEFVCVVSSTLPKIIPNILLVKRDEVISLLICTIFLHPNQSQRDKLLQILLSLKKKMEKDDRALIISGLVVLLQWNAEVNYGLDSDLLGFFWEMLNSKSTEKRILGAEASVALAPYVSLDLVNSLLLSMVLSMCDANDSSIRKQGLLGAIIICPTAAPTKYAQLENIFFNLAFDREVSLSNLCIERFTPVLARSTLLNGSFHNEFCLHIFTKLQHALENPNNSEDIIIILKILNSIVLFAFCYVIDVDIINTCDLESIEMIENEKWFCEYLNKKPFHNPNYILLNKSVNAFKLFQAFYDLIGSEFSGTWEERDWFIECWLKRMLDTMLNSQNAPTNEIINAYIDIFETMCHIFGASFVNKILKPFIEDALVNIEQKMIKAEIGNAFILITISISLGLFSTSEGTEYETIVNVVNRWCICCGMCSVSPQFIGMPIVRYSKTKPALLTPALTAMWQCVVHARERVRAYIAYLFYYIIQFGELSDDVMNTSIVPAIVTLVSDSTVSVKCNAIKGLGEVICKSQLPAAAHDKCWLSLESLVIEEKSNGTLGAHTTICLVKTFYEIVKNKSSNSNKVLPNLIMLCYSPVLSSDNTSTINNLLGELLPALQLATQIDLSENFVQNNLLPALKKLECLEHILSDNKLTIESLIHKLSACDQKEHISTNVHINPSHSLPGILANSESVGRRVTQMFQNSKPGMNLQNIFKKK